MKDDLISRTVLQEKNREFFKDCITKDKFDMDVTECNVAMQELLNNQPTAYEVDKVVEQLEKSSILVATSKEFWDNPQNGEFVAEVVSFDTVIEIVKAGGRE